MSSFVVVAFYLFIYFGGRGGGSNVCCDSKPALRMKVSIVRFVCTHISQEGNTFNLLRG